MKSIENINERINSYLTQNFDYLNNLEHLKYIGKLNEEKLIFQVIDEKLLDNINHCHKSKFQKFVNLFSNEA